jgi:hypothetical protein
VNWIINSLITPNAAIFQQTAKVMKETLPIVWTAKRRNIINGRKSWAVKFIQEETS